ncbi:hypothetical protein BJ742DRAFT_279927 [Cladochytrium replicatum]|nr:hypothetical protein BJ742DRAFT_279927 [Cladochytrium replicatum]
MISQQGCLFGGHSKVWHTQRLMAHTPILAGQLWALLYKNYLVFRRNNRLLFSVTVYPLLSAVFLAFYIRTLFPWEPIVLPEIKPVIGKVVPVWPFPTPNLTASPLPVLAFTPNRVDVRSIVDRVADRIRSGIADPLWVDVRGFSDLNELINFHRSTNNSVVWAAIEFAESNLFNYTLLMQSGEGPELFDDQKDRAACRLRGPSGCSSRFYLNSGLLFLQQALDDELLGLNRNLLTETLRFPPITYSRVPPAGRYFLDITVVSSALSYLIIIVATVVREKESKVRLTMFIQGVQPAAWTISWLLTFCVGTVGSGVAPACVYWKLVMPYASFTLISLLFVGLQFCNIAFALLLSTILKTTRGALAAVGMLSFFTPFIIPVLDLLSVDVSARFWFGLVCYPIAFVAALDEEMYKLQPGVGLSWDHFFESNAYKYCFTLIILCVIYLILAIYIDTVAPIDLGGGKRWDFFLDPRNQEQSESSDPSNDASEEPSNDIEPEPKHLPIAIKLQHLRKEYGKLVAVDNLSFNLFTGEIFALLGFNGAGKTTVLNLITGVVQPTRGTAIVYGKDVRTDAASIRQRVGFVNQNNIIFETLTAKEHVTIWGMLKGVKAGEELLAKVNLSDKADTAAEKLSGGEKRRLMVAIALVSDPSILILDEPSSGLDPRNRQRLWEVLRSNKENRLTLLTTHHMDEADLADRKAVLSTGRLRCLGTSFFLKKRFNVGYMLESDRKIDDIVARSYSHPLNGAPSARLARTSINSADHRFEQRWELDHVDAGFLRDLEKEGVVYSLSMPSLEEVFVRTEGEGAASEENNGHSGIGNAESEPLLSTTEHKSTLGLYFRQLATLTYVNLVVLFRVRNGLFNVLIGPLLSWLVVVFFSSLAGSGSTAVVDLAVSNGCSVLRNANLSNYLIQITEVCDNHEFTMQKRGNLETRNLETVSISYYDLYNDLDLKLLFSERDSPAGNTPVDLLPGLSSLHGALGVPLESLTDQTEGWKPLDAWLDQHAPQIGGFQATAWRNQKEDGSLTWARDLETSVGSVLDEKRVLNVDAVIYFNESFVHAPGIALNVQSNLINKALNPHAPLLLTSYGLLEKPIKDAPQYPGSSGDGEGVDSLGLIAIYYLPMLLFGTYVQFAGSEYVRERKLGTLQQLDLMGLPTSVYWIASWAAKSSFIMPGILVLLAALIGFSNVPSFSGAAAPMFCLTIILFAVSIVAMALLISQLFNSEEGLASISWTFSFLMFLPIFLFFAALASGDIDGFFASHQLYSVVFPLYPPVANLICLFLVHLLVVFGIIPPLTVSDYFNPQLPMRFALLAMVFHCVLWAFLFSFAMPRHSEWVYRTHARKTFWRSIVRFFRFKPEIPEVPQSSSAIPEDVLQERERVRDMAKDEEDAMIVSDVTVRYDYPDPKSKKIEWDGKLAVSHASLGVDQGQICSLVGPNGSGKSSLLSAIVGSLAPTSGEIRILGQRHPISGSSNLGYCPQFDALWPKLTTREHLWLLSQLRPSQNANAQIDRFIRVLGLTPHLNKFVDELSGGSRRKVSYSVAALGKPAVQVLDEPTTGLDPVSRKKMWALIEESREGTATLLTSHFLEETDFLSTRITIMVSGRQQCVGSPAQLKARFGKNYILQIPVSGARGEEAVRQWVTARFPSALANADSFRPVWEWAVPASDAEPLSRSFEDLERGRKDGIFGEYSLARATLETVFLNIAKTQEEGGENEASESDALM